MAQYIVRYEVFLPLGAGGSRVGSYRTLDQAKAHPQKDLQIWKTYYTKSKKSGKLFKQGEVCCGRT